MGHFGVETVMPIPDPRVGQFLVLTLSSNAVTSRDALVYSKHLR